MVAGPVLFAEDSDDRAKLTGAWQEQTASAAHAVWTFEEQGPAMHVTNSQGDKKVVEFLCGLGKECEAKDAGKKVKVTVYFNGAKLVIMETRGDQVFKRRFGVGPAGDILEVEMIPVSPEGKPETVHFTRLQTASAAAAKP